MGASKMKLVAPMSEQIVTTKMSLLIHPSEVHCFL